MRKIVSMLLGTAATVLMLGMVYAGNAHAAAWTKQVGTTSSDYASGIAVDASGNSYVAGWTYGALGGANAGKADIVVMKFDAAGVGQWTRQLGTSADDVATCVAVDGSGNVYEAGYTGGVLDGTNMGGNDIFVVKFNASGVKQWTRQLGTSSNDGANCIAVDSGGNVYAAGMTNGDLDGNTNEGVCDIFLVKYDSSGARQWTKQIGTNTCDKATGLALDPGGNVYLAGWTNSGLDGNTSAGNADLVVVKFDTSGVKQWTSQMGTSGDEFASGIALDSSGNIYVSGWTDGGLDGNTNAGGYDLFAVKFDPSGVKQWTRQLGTALDEYATGVCTDAYGNVYLSGYTNGGLDGNLNAGDNDLILVKWDSSGAKLKTWQKGTASADWAKGVAVDGSLNVFLTGFTVGGLDGNANLGGVDIFVTKLTASVTIASSTNPITVNNKTTFTASVGETGSYEYSFWLYGPGTGNAWALKAAYSTSNTWDWTPTSTDKGTNWVCVKVRDQGSSAAWESWTGIAVSVVSPASTVQMSASPSQSAYAGNTVKFTAWASGSSGTYEYSFWQVSPTGVWTLTKAYSSGNNWSWTPSTSDVGTNYVVVYARNTGSGAKYEAYTYSAFTVKAPIAPTAAKLTAYPSLVYAGNAVTFTASASGGSGPYQYKFWLVSPAGAWTLKQDYSSSNSWTWTPSVSDRGSNYVIVWVRNAVSSASYETYTLYNVYVH